MLFLIPIELKNPNYVLIIAPIQFLINNFTLYGKTDPLTWCANVI